MMEWMDMMDQPRRMRKVQFESGHKPNSGRIAVAASLLAMPGVAAAHDAVIPHAHPHGVDSVLILGAIGIALLVGYLLGRAQRPSA